MFKIIALITAFAALVSVETAAPVSATETPAPSVEVAVVEGTPAEQAPLTIVGARRGQAATIEWAIDRYAEAGLPLPPLEIYVHDDRSDCDGERGVYKWNDTLNRIDMCVDTMFVLLHEIAHAWEVRYATEAARDEFTESLGLVEWRSDDVEWGDRASERAANTVAFGLLPRELSQNDVLANAAILDRFTALTGVESPRLPSA